MVHSAVRVHDGVLHEAAVLVDLLLGDDVGLVDRLRRSRESALLARERRAAAECTRQYHADVLALICFVSRAQVLSVRGKKVLEMLVRKPSARFLRLAGNEP